MKKHIIRILLILLAVLLLLYAALKVYVAIEERKRADAPGNAEAYDVDNLEKHTDSPLAGKTILFLGSSVTDGAAAEGQSFVELFQTLDGVNAIKEAKSGTTLVDKNSVLAAIAFGNGDSYVKRIKQIDTSAQIDCVVVQLSTNDATMKQPLGEISEGMELAAFDTQTVTGAMEWIIRYSRDTWNCPVVFYTGSHYDSAEYAAMVERLFALQDKWDLGNPEKEQLLYQYVTGFPVAAAVAQCWNTPLAEEIGRAVSAEMTEYGVTWWLAPALNIVRNPLCGRNYEYYSEDPLLSGKLAAAVTRGVQATPGNYVTVKHFAANNQEENRYYISSDLDERTLREIYLRGFEIVVREAAPRAVMSAYNKINGVYCANNRELCTDILRGEWGFDGVVMTDWLSTGEDRADEAGCLSAGVDLIMPGGKKVVKALLKAYKDGRLTDETLRHSCGRVLEEILPM